MKVLDLFSGIGGFSLALEKCGMETVAFCEIDEHCHKVLKKHWPNTPIIKDIKTLNGKLLNDIYGKIVLICGGFPCQDKSVAGNKKGLIDEKGQTTRSGLWFEYKRIIGEARPNYVIIENVANLRSNGLVTVLQDLWTLGYDAEWHIISARAVGSCHLRERIWVIAYPNGEGLERSNESGGGGGANRKKTLSDSGPIGVGRKIESPNSDLIRIWKPFASSEKKTQWWTETSASFRDRWKIAPSLCRMDDGLSKRLDESERFRKQRIKQLGNSVVPQIIELIGKQIIQHEKGMKK